MRDSGQKPVVMLVTATITDNEAYGRYMTALVASGLLAEHGAVPYATGPAASYLEGGQPNDVAAILRFPSAEAACAFWTDDSYREIAKLRRNAGAFQVGIWRMLPTIT